jgi:hypothetical protein
VILKLKAFIYRLSDVFRLSIYLANKEEEKYIDTLGPLSQFSEDIERGTWQAQNGFTTVWAWKQPWYRAFWTRLKHAFDFRSFR